MPRLGVRVPLSPPLSFFYLCAKVYHAVSISSIYFRSYYERSLNKPVWLVPGRLAEIPSSPQLVWGWLWGYIVVVYCHSTFTGKA